MDLDQFLTTPEIVVSVPGAWATREEVVAAIAEQSGGFQLSDNRLTDATTGESFRLEVSRYNPEVRRVFAIAGHQSLTYNDLEALDQHRQMLYLIAPGGSKEAARAAMKAARGLLHAGGMAVKVETTGIAHSARDWLALTEHPGVEAFYFAFVILVEKEGVFFSCGMHNMGLPDAIVPDSIDPDEAGAALESFLVFVLEQTPELAEGDTFRDTPDSPPYRLTQEPCTLYPKGNLFHNPYGLWRLTPILSSGGE